MLHQKFDWIESLGRVLGANNSGLWLALRFQGTPHPPPILGQNIHFKVLISKIFILKQLSEIVLRHVFRINRLA
jgi:hypothetical protein